MSDKTRKDLENEIKRTRALAAPFDLSCGHFHYEVSDYNGTRFNERAVEVPVGRFLEWYAVREDKHMLEVGAVLPHYSTSMWLYTQHTVIDLHEEYPGVTNADVLTWEPPHQYDLIISISTLDHLRNEDEFHCALERLKSWLAPGGLLYVTLPFGQPAWVGGGAWIDRFLLATDLGPQILCEPDARLSAELVLRQTKLAMWRMDKIDPIKHLWAQIHDSSVPPLAYNGQSPAANTVYMLFWGDVYGWLVR